jgi:hypothetical protein
VKNIVFFIASPFVHPSIPVGRGSLSRCCIAVSFTQRFCSAFNKNAAAPFFIPKFRRAQPDKSRATMPDRKPHPQKDLGRMGLTTGDMADIRLGLDSLDSSVNGVLSMADIHTLFLGLGYIASSGGDIVDAFVSAADLQMAAGGREALNIEETIELFAKASYCMSIRVLLLHLVCAA